LVARREFISVWNDLVQRALAELGYSDLSQTTAAERVLFAGGCELLWLALETSLRDEPTPRVADGSRNQPSRQIAIGLGLSKTEADSQRGETLAEIVRARADGLLLPSFVSLWGEADPKTSSSKLHGAQVEHELPCLTQWLENGRCSDLVIAALRLTVAWLLSERGIELPQLAPQLAELDPATRQELLDFAAHTHERNTDRTVTTPRESPPPSTDARHVDENVVFAVYRPNEIIAEQWTKLLAFAHLSDRRPGSDAHAPSPLEQVEQQARTILGAELSSYRARSEDASQGIPFEGQISFVPRVEGFEFDPPRHTFRWIDDVHRAEFRMRASAALAQTVARGELLVLLGGLVVGTVSLRFEVRSRGTASVRAQTFEHAGSARPYRKVFASYSHHDRSIVDHIAAVARSMGDRYLIDHQDLRAGEEWSEALERLIKDADAFQLFWSNQSMRSPFVRKEWEYALSLGRPSFVRPAYWEEPLPEWPEYGLPPHELRCLHFFAIASLPIAGSTRSAVAGQESATRSVTEAIGATSTAPTIAPPRRRRYDFWSAFTSLVAGLLLVLKTGSLDAPTSASEQLLALAKDARGQELLEAPWGRRAQSEHVTRVAVPELDAESAGAALCLLGGVMLLLSDGARRAMRSAPTAPRAWLALRGRDRPGRRCRYVGPVLSRSCLGVRRIRRRCRPSNRVCCRCGRRRMRGRGRERSTVRAKPERAVLQRFEPELDAGKPLSQSDREEVERLRRELRERRRRTHC
jgi:hypothetical protein